MICLLTISVIFIKKIKIRIRRFEKYIFIMLRSGLSRAYLSSHERAFSFSAKARNGACFLFLFWGFTPLLALFLRSLRQLLGFLIEEDLGSLDQKVLTRDVDFRLIFLHN